MQTWLLLGVVTINVLTFGLFALDKWKARRRAWRIPESQLLLACAFTGAVGGWIAMNVLRHKTQKRSFQVWMVLATAVNALWVWLWWTWRDGGLR